MDILIAHLPPKVAAYLPLDNSAYIYASGTDVIDVTKTSLWLAVGAIFFNPIYWNIVARNEYRNKTLTKLFGSPYAACYFLAVTIFSLGILRDGLYEKALRDQPHFEPFAHLAVKGIALTLFVIGQIFVVTSIYALGVTGTYLGDYCGILMSSRVTGFPFNVLSDPMYVGSALAFLGTALWFESPAGVVISVVVWFVYAVALRFEGPFTNEIYSSHSKREETASTSAPSTPPKSNRVTGNAISATENSNGLSTATPRRNKARKSVIAAADVAESSPRRVTRSRSKARMSDDE